MTAQVRVGGLRGYSLLVKRMGGDPRHYTDQCGIPYGLLDNEDALIPYRQLIHLLELTATDLNVPDFGLRLAASQDIGVLGPLAMVMQNSATVEEAMRCGATYLFVQSPALSLDIEPLTQSTRVRLNIRLNSMPHGSMRQAEDLGIGVTHGVLQLLGLEHYDLLSVELPHEPLCPTSVYETFFGAPVTFNCAQNALYVSHGTLSARLGSHSETLHRLAADYLDVQLPSPDGRVTSRVETAVRKTMGTDSCDRESIARAMAMHPRTLQRRLEREGESFDEIRDRIRRERAQYYLCSTDLPLAQVAGILGYAEQAILTRSCRRWYGTTPRRLRASGPPPRKSR
jgi:AraC-like DNA-binding protein